MGIILTYQYKFRVRNNVTSLEKVLDFYAKFNGKNFSKKNAPMVLFKIKTNLKTNKISVSYL